MRKLLGAALTLVGCAGIGFCLCQEDRRTYQETQRMIKALQWMLWELNYRMSPLRELCLGGAEHSGGMVGKTLTLLAQELDRQMVPDVSVCMETVLQVVGGMPRNVAGYFTDLGAGFGKFDLQGQAEALEATLERCKTDLLQQERNRGLRLRNYRALSLCAGAALIILLL